MSYSIFSNFWPLFALLNAGLQIAASVLLIRDRGWIPWLMLVGAALSTLGQFSGLITHFLFPAFSRNSNFMIYEVSNSVTFLGLLLFSLGLLVYALHRRRQADRVAELEAILASIQKP
jgi:hypothetical protein